ncbi:MAG: hypothetical protein AB7K52_08935 [Phycisphaerales bacterium]
MFRMKNGLRNLVLSVVASASVLLLASDILADTFKMKDGRTIECEVVREEDTFWVVKLASGQTEYLDKADVREVIRTAPAKPAETKPAEAKPEAAKPADSAQKKDEPAKTTPPASTAAPSKDGAKRPRSIDGVSRVAVLNFGPPSAWQGKIDSTVGIQINAKAWKDAIPLLEKDKVDVVVVRVNSGGGYLLELTRFHDVFENEYKKRFRTVAWIESAISAACMSPWVIEEWYFMPEGNAGACTGWFGNLQMMQGPELLEVLYQMEKVSALGRHAKEIMRSMQIVEPLSCNIDANNNVTWFQDETGKYLVNPAGEILTFNARDAVKYGFAKGIAATEEELVKVMGLNEVEFVGKAATKYIDDNMKKNDEADKTWQDVLRKYLVAVNGAVALQGEQNRDRRLIEVGVAKRHLNKLEDLLKVNPLLSGQLRPGWMQEQRELLKQLAQ